MTAAILPLAAAANAALLAIALAYRSCRRRAKAGLYAAAFLGVAAAAVALIALDHAGAVANARAAATAEGALTLASGPLFVLFVAALLGARTRAELGLAALAAFLMASLVWPNWVSTAFAVERLVLVQMAFTAWAAALAFRHQPAGRRAANARSFAFAAIAALGLLHLAQLTRMLLPDIEAVANIVPLAGAAGFLAATAAVYFGGRVSALDPLVEAPPPADDAARALVRALDQALQAGLLRNADLTLAQAARAVGAPQDRLARALRAAHGRTFAEHLQRRRVEEAMRLLRDPAEARTSMEAIGLLAGFGSRSAFYKAFAERAGASPAAYRTRNRVQAADSGQ